MKGRGNGLERMNLGRSIDRVDSTNLQMKVTLPTVVILNMICQQLDQLEQTFIEARFESEDLDTFGWTDRELSCLKAILDHKREGHQGERGLAD
jgi:hypothetical protein